MSRVALDHTGAVNPVNPVNPVNVIDIGPKGIRLGQFLKFAGAVDTGGETKALLESGDVTVNGVIEPRRGAQLHPGDLVTVRALSYRIT